MKLPFLTMVLLLLVAGANPVHAQYGSQSSTGANTLTCWQCPVCGYVVSMTQAEAASVNPYTLCPSCNSAYAGYFVPVSCQAVQGSGTNGNTGLNTGYGTTGRGYGTNYGTGYGTGTNYGTGYGNSPLGNDGADENSGASNTETSSVNSGSSLPGQTTTEQSGSSTVPTKGKILMVLAPEQYQEDELNLPRDYFLSMGYSVVLASKGGKTATGMNGGSASIDLDLKDAKPSDYIAVIFVGGEGIYNLKLNEDSSYQALAKSAVAQKKLTGAICLGPWILADAGLLKGKKATASDTDHLKAKGAIVSDEAVVRDGNIITGNGPSAAQEFAEAIVAALQESGSGSSTVNDNSGGQEGVSSSEISTALKIPIGNQAGSGNAKTAATTATASKWKCTVCGYIYDPAENGNVPFEQLPSTWKCPCGAPKSKFVKV